MFKCRHVPMKHICCPCIWPVDANTYSTWSTGRVAVTDIGFPRAHMEPIHSLQQELGRRMKNAGIQVLDGIDATNGPMLQQLMPNASMVIWGSPHCNHFGKMKVCQHLAPGENNTSFKLAAFINKTHRKLKKSNMYVFMYICKLCHFLELLARLNWAHYDSIDHQGAH